MYASRSWRTLVLALAAFWAVLLPAGSAPPRTLHYQGFLTSSAGQPVNGPASITFRLHGSATDSTPLWEETQSVTVANGHYQAILGNGVALDGLPFDELYYLAVIVEGQALLPRQPFTMVPYAFRAETLSPSAIVQGAQVQGTLSNVTISGATLQGARLADSVAVCDAASQGALRWAAQSGTFEGCTGTAWVALAQEPLFALSTLGSFFEGLDSGQQAMAIGGDGFPVIAYAHGSADDLIVLKCVNRACSEGTAVANVDSADIVGSSPAIAVGADGMPVIAYRSQSQTGLKVTKCGNLACTSGNVQTVIDSGNGSVGVYNAIAIAGDKLPVISHHDTTNRSLKVAKCANVECSKAEQTTVDASGYTGWFTSIAVGADGLPVIAYYDVAASALKVAKCHSHNCQKNTVTVIGPAATARAAIGISAKLPVLAYVGAGSPWQLHFAMCSDPACAKGATSTPIAPTFGSAVWMEIASDGLPALGYRDAAGTLTLLKCGNPACSGGNTTFAVTAIPTADFQMARGSDGLPVFSLLEVSGNQQLVKVAKCTSGQCR